MIIALSCTSEENPIPLSQNGTLLVSAKMTNDGQSWTANYTLDGSKVLTARSADENDGITHYQYTGDFITGILNGNGSAWATLTYDSQQRIIKKSWPSGAFWETYEYPDSSTVLIKLYRNYELSEKQTLHLVNGEIASFENELKRDSGEWKYSSYEFTYDDKHNPRSGWLNYDKLVYTWGNRQNVHGSRHNVLSVVETTPGVLIPDSAWYEITYNDQDFPTKIKVVDENGNDSPTGYTFEFWYTN